MFSSRQDLAVFKALFDRTKDWADIEAMIETNAVDLQFVGERLSGLLGDDPRVARVRVLAVGTHQ